MKLTRHLIGWINICGHAFVICFHYARPRAHLSFNAFLSQLSQLFSFSLLSSTTITTSSRQIKEQQFCEIFFLIYDFCIPGIFVKNIEGQFSFQNHVSSLTAKIYKDSIRFLRNFSVSRSILLFGRITNGTWISSFWLTVFSFFA